MSTNYAEAVRSVLVAFLLTFALSGSAISAQAAAQGPSKNGLVLWLKADDGLAQDGSSWADRSGRGHDVTALPGQAPTYVSNAINGLPVARFNGDQAMAVNGELLDSQTFTIIAVLTDTSDKNTGFKEIISNWDSSDSSTSVFLGTLWTGVTGKTLDRIRFTDSVGGLDQGQTGVGKIRKPAKPFILTGTSMVNNAIVRVGTRVQYKLGTALPARGLSTAWYLGRQGSLDGEYWIGDVAEVLVYDKALSKAEIESQIAYLSSKWQ